MRPALRLPTVLSQMPSPRSRAVHILDTKLGPQSVCPGFHRNKRSALGSIAISSRRWVLADRVFSRKPTFLSRYWVAARPGSFTLNQPDDGLLRQWQDETWQPGLPTLCPSPFSLCLSPPLPCPPLSPLALHLPLPPQSCAPSE